MYAIPATCTVFGMIFFHIAAFGCKTFKSEFSTGSAFFGYNYSFDSKVGYWSADAGGSCFKYGNASVSGAFKFGRFIGVVGALLIWAIFFAVTIASFFKYPQPKRVFRVIGICMGVVSFFSFLLLVGTSEEYLQLAGGGVLAILSALIWAGGAVSMFLCMNERATSAAAADTKSPSSAPETTTAAAAPNKEDPEATTNDGVEEEV